MKNRHAFTSYRETASYGHFGRATFPWEKLNRVAKLKARAKDSLAKNK